MSCASCRHWLANADGAAGRCTLNPVWVATQASHYCGQEQARGDVAADRVKLWDDVPLPLDEPDPDELDDMVSELLAEEAAASVALDREGDGQTIVVDGPTIQPRPSARAAARRRRQGGDQ